MHFNKIDIMFDRLNKAKGVEILNSLDYSWQLGLIKEIKKINGLLKIICEVHTTNPGTFKTPRDWDDQLLTYNHEINLQINDLIIFLHHTTDSPSLGLILNLKDSGTGHYQHLLFYSQLDHSFKNKFHHLLKHQTQASH